MASTKDMRLFSLVSWRCFPGGGGCAEDSGLGGGRQYLNVVPANAGTHNHRPLICESCRPPRSIESTTRYGSRRSPGRRVEGVTALLPDARCSPPHHARCAWEEEGRRSYADAVVTP